jgi:hypothetical protein
VSASSSKIKKLKNNSKSFFRRFLEAILEAIKATSKMKKEKTTV